MEKAAMIARTFEGQVFFDFAGGSGVPNRHVAHLTVRTGYKADHAYYLIEGVYIICLVFF